MSSPGPGTDRSVDVVDGKLFKPLLVLSAPIVASQVLNVGYNLADTFWVGRLGSDPVAALGYAWAIIFMVASLAIGLTIAGAVLVAQHKGNDNQRMSHHVAGQTFSFVTVLAFFLAVIGYLGSPILVDFVGATPGTAPYEQAVSYTRIMFIGIVFVFWFFLFDAVCRGWGDTRTPMYLMAVSVGINVVVDPFFILGFEGNPIFLWLGMESLQATLLDMTGFTGWGVEGAAIATVLSRGFAAILGVVILFSGRIGIQPTIDDLWFDFDAITDIVRIGAPSAAELLMRSVGMAVMTIILAMAGDDAVAAWGILHRLSSLLFMPALGLARGTETVVGQNIGAGQLDRAKRAVYLSSVVILSGFAIIISLSYPYAEGIVGVFLNVEGSGNPELVIDMGAEYIRIAGPAYLAQGILRMMLGGLRGSGSTRAAMIFTLLEMWILRLPLAYVFLALLDMGVTGVWWAVAASYVLTTVITGVWFLRGTWLSGVVDSESEPPSQSRPEAIEEPTTDD